MRAEVGVQPVEVADEGEVGLDVRVDSLAGGVDAFVGAACGGGFYRMAVIEFGEGGFDDFLDARRVGDFLPAGVGGSFVLEFYF